MTQAVEKFVRECDSCQRRQRGTEFRSPLGEVRQPTLPFELCHMDLVGPFALSAARNRYILTFIAQLTKYVEAVPVPDTTASTCAKRMPPMSLRGIGQAKPLLQIGVRASQRHSFKKHVRSWGCDTSPRRLTTPRGMDPLSVSIRRSINPCPTI
jgi:hypothetical protein